MTQRLPDPRHLLSRLQREWDHLAVSPEALATVRRWPIVIGRVATLDDILRRTGYGVAGTAPHHDAMLRELIRLARHDPLAARIVLQRLLPGIAAIGRRRTPPFGDPLEALDEALASAWTVIRTVRIERWDRYVIVNLLKEIDYHAFRRARRRKCEFVPTITNLLDEHPAFEEEPTSADELRELLDDARRAGFEPADVELAERFAAGATANQIAAEQKVTPRTVRNHRETVVYRLRQLALACA
jgi:hypothetical protein